MLIKESEATGLVGDRAAPCWLDVRDELVEAVRLSWRLPRERAHSVSPFASDAPFYLMTRLDRTGSPLLAWRQEQDEILARRRRGLADVPLSADQVDWVHRRLDWIALVGEEDRLLVRLAVRDLARSGRVRWSDVRGALPGEAGNKGLYRRFVRALRALASELDRPGARARAR